MEFLKLSKFRLQLQSLINEAGDARERERSVTEQLHLVSQKQKQCEEEYCREIHKLQTELASSNELRQTLERKVNYLQNDNALFENKVKELKGTIQNLLQSKESFVNAYQESTCEMKRSIQARDKKIAVLYEKINSHLLLFDSIEKEAFAVNQVVDDIHRVLREKEDIVAGLRSKMDHVSGYEKVFTEKICDLRNKVKNCEIELQRKDNTILELKTQLEAAKISSNSQTQLELQKILSAKDEVIQNLVSEKEALHSEVESLGIILQRIQQTVTSMDEEDRSAFHVILARQKNYVGVKDDGNDRTDGLVQNERKESQSGVSDTCTAENKVNVLHSDSPPFQECNSATQGKSNFQWSNPEQFACSSPQSTCFVPPSTANVLSISANDNKCNWTVSDSECSTTQAETKEHHGSK